MGSVSGPTKMRETY